MILRPNIARRLEGAFTLAACVWLYHQYGQGWLLFGLCFLLPDLSMLGYMKGPKFGAFLYNLAHWYVWPICLAVLGLTTSQNWALTMALIWGAHIGFDRMLGYGLKFDTDFKHTDLKTLNSSRKNETK